MIEVTYGPIELFHSSLDLELLNNPPPGVRYLQASPEYKYLTFLPKRVRFDPARHFAFEEVHEYAGRHRFIQSRLYPVANKVPWMVSSDDILAHATLGHTLGFNVHLDRWLEKKYSLDLILERTYRMLSHFASPYCVAFDFEKEVRRKYFMEIMRRTLPRELAGLIDKIEAKSVVIRNSQVPRTTKAEVRRRMRQRCKTIMFVGRYFEHKGGHLILKLYSELQRDPRLDLDLIYIGKIEDEYKRRYKELLKKIEYYPAVSREDIFKLMLRSNLLLVPSRFDSGPQISLEAMSCGLPQIVSAGKGMHGVEEYLYDGQNCRLIYKNSIERHPSYGALKEHTLDIISNEKRLSDWGCFSLEMVENGILSVNERNKKLLAIYRDAAVPRHFVPELIMNKGILQERRLSAGKVERRFDSYTREKKIPRSRLAPFLDLSKLHFDIKNGLPTNDPKTTILERK